MHDQESGSVNHLIQETFVFSQILTAVTLLLRYRFLYILAGRGLNLECVWRRGGHLPNPTSSV